MNDQSNHRDQTVLDLARRSREDGIPPHLNAPTIIRRARPSASGWFGSVPGAACKRNAVRKQDAGLVDQIRALVVKDVAVARDSQKIDSVAEMGAGPVTRAITRPAQAPL